MIKDKYLSRLIRAHPAQAAAQLDRTPPAPEAAAGMQSVLSAFDDATNNPMGKALTLAVMLDQDESEEHKLDPSTRDRAAQLFESIFVDLAST